MVSLKARLLLLVAYVGSVTVVVTIERYWTSSGYRIADFVRLESTDLLIIVLVLAVIGLLFCAFVVLLGLITVANRFFASYGQLSRPAACNCGDKLPHRRDDGNAIDVSVHPTDTTVAAGGPALVAPHYNVSLMHLTETRRPPAPSCPPPQGSVNYHYPSLQHINQTSPSVVVEPTCFARN